MNLPINSLVRSAVKTCLLSYLVGSLNYNETCLAWLVNKTFNPLFTERLTRHKLLDFSFDLIIICIKSLISMDYVKTIVMH